MFVLSLYGAAEYRNSQINCISQLLTVLSIFLTLSPTLIYPRFAPRVAFFPDVALFMHTRPPQSLLRHLMHLWRLQWVKREHDPLLKTMYKTKVLFAFYVGGGNCFYFRVSAGIVGGVATKVAGRDPFGCHGVAETGLPFDRDFPLGRVRRIALDNLDVEVKH